MTRLAITFRHPSPRAGLSLKKSGRAAGPFARDFEELARRGTGAAFVDLSRAVRYEPPKS